MSNEACHLRRKDNVGVAVDVTDVGMDNINEVRYIPTKQGCNAQAQPTMPTKLSKIQQSSNFPGFF